MFNSVVKESCFKHLHDVIATSVCEKFYRVLLQKAEAKKFQNGKFFYPRARPIIIYWLQLTPTKQFRDGGLTQRKNFFNN